MFVIYVWIVYVSYRLNESDEVIDFAQKLRKFEVPAVSIKTILCLLTDVLHDALICKIKSYICLKNKGSNTL